MAVGGVLTVLAEAFPETFGVGTAIGDILGGASSIEGVATFKDPFSSGFRYTAKDPPPPLPAPGSVEPEAGVSGTVGDISGGTSTLKKGTSAKTSIP